MIIRRLPTRGNVLTSLQKPRRSLVSAATAFLIFGLLSQVSSASGVQAAVSQLTVSPSTISGAGGNLQITASTSNVNSCMFMVSSSISQIIKASKVSGGICYESEFLPANYSSSSLDIEVEVVVGSSINNSSSAQQSITEEPYLGSNTSTTLPTSNTTTTLEPTVGNTIKVPIDPVAMTDSGSDIWVASCGDNIVTEIDSISKSVIREITGPQYQFECPDALAIVGSNVWVANKMNNSLTEFNDASGSWIRTLTGAEIYNPLSLVSVRGNFLWVGEGSTFTIGDPRSFQDPSLVKINTVSGSVIARTRNTTPEDSLEADPVDMTTDGSNIWVGEDGNEQEFDQSGKFVRNLDSAYAGGGGCWDPTLVSYYAGHIWGAGDGICENNASNGKVVGRILAQSTAILAKGGSLYLAGLGDEAKNLGLVQKRSLNGAVLKTYTSYNFSNFGYGPGVDALILEGGQLWIANGNTDVVSFFKL